MHLEEAAAGRARDATWESGAAAPQSRQRNEAETAAEVTRAVYESRPETAAGRSGTPGSRRSRAASGTRAGLRLDPFRDDPEIQPVGHRDGRGAEGGVLRVELHAADEQLVDLQDVDRKRFRYESDE